MLYNPRSAIAGLWSVFKFGFDRIYSFGDIAIFYILPFFGLKLPIHAHFIFFGGGVVEGIFPPNDVIHHPNP